MTSLNGILRRTSSWLLGCASAAATPACCVASGSRVRTPDGEVPIERLGVGDAVLSFDVERGAFVPTRVSAIRSALRSCVSLRTKTSTLVCTPDHPIYMSDRASYEDAVAAIPGRPVALASADGARPTAVDSVGIPSGLHRVIDISVESPLHNFVAEGVLVHNKEFADCSSASALPDVVTLDEAKPMQRLLLRACRRGQDVPDLSIDAHINVRVQEDAIDVVRVAAYFETGERVEIVEGLAPFSDFLSVFPSEGSCTEGIPLVVERLDSELDIPGSVIVSLHAAACEGNPLEDLSLDVELAE